MKKVFILTLVFGTLLGATLLGEVKDNLKALREKTIGEAQYNKLGRSNKASFDNELNELRVTLNKYKRDLDEVDIKLEKATSVERINLSEVFTLVDKDSKIRASMEKAALMFEFESEEKYDLKFKKGHWHIPHHDHFE